MIFLFWRISRQDEQHLLCRVSCEEGMVAHIFVVRGQIDIRRYGTIYNVTSSCFGTFIELTELEILYIGPDTKAYILAMGRDFSTNLIQFRPPFPITFFIKVLKEPITPLLEESVRHFEDRFENIDNVYTNITGLFRKEMVKSAMWMLLLEIANQFIKFEGLEKIQAGDSRRKEIMMNFINLMTKHSSADHNVDFYASKLCISRQYLNRVLCGYSNVTASKWIAFTLTGKISWYLNNTTMPIQRIAELLGFPSQAALAKFFKQQTGITPTDFRNQSFPK